MSRRWRRVATWLFLAAAVAFVLVALADRWAALERMRAEMGGFGWRFSPGWLAASLAVGVADLFWMGAVWVYLYRSGGGRLGWIRGIRVWMATNLGRYIPGKVWQLSGLAVHLRETGESGSLGLASALVFQVVVLVTGIAVAVAVLGGDVALLPGGSLATAVAAAVLLLALLHPAVIRWGMRLTGRLLDREEAPAAQPPPGRALVRAAAGMVVAWSLYGIGLWCLFRGLTETPGAGPVLLSGVFAASYVVGYLVLVAPGGLLVREGAMTALLAALTPLGAGVAAALAVAARIWATVAELVAAATVLAGAGGGSRSAVGRSGSAGSGEEAP